MMTIHTLEVRVRVNVNWAKQVCGGVGGVQYCVYGDLSVVFIEGFRLLA